MRSNVSSALMGLPGPAKAGIILIGSGGVVAALRVSGLPLGQIFWILLIGSLFVGVLLWIYAAFLKWREKRKADPMARQLVENVGAAPRGVSDPARRAELAGLRKKFEEGLEKFRAAGKNIYSVPWYLFVGEPGSGKTEAVRHCNVPFPPGMQDQLQGAGGTINMDWWFTNHAIIIDTAGKLMFNEVEAGAGPEWQELLRLLKAGRPSCPINGMLLAISAESLITDTADEIERKAGKIAQQFDLVQRSLGVRFPVFVIITKADLVNGFREFFKTVDDPQLQHQMLGWSNPASLDSAFNPAEVETHLQLVHRRLLRHRLWLLHDPVAEDPAGRRIDEVDRLYDFPEALLRIIPRLRRYLEMVFVSGEWSPKPLFLRGIYFTSSLREGEALDAVLAEAIGVDVKALPSGGIWDRDRAFFLRDLFMEKVFKERGLVTQATSARGVQRKRRAVVLGAAIVSVVLLLAMVILSGRWYRQGLEKHLRFWESMEAAVVDPDNFEFGPPEIVLAESYGASEFDYERMPVTVGDLEEEPFPLLLSGTRAHLEAARPSQAVPLVLRPARIGGGDLDRQRIEAFCTIVDRHYLQPLVVAAARKFKELGGDDGAGWTMAHTEALEQLLLMKRHGTGLTPRATVNGQPKTPQIAPLLRLALGDERFEDGQKGPGGASGDPARMQETIDWLYFERGHGFDDPSTAWTAAADRLDHDAEEGLQAAINLGLEQFKRAWSELGSAPGSQLGQLSRLADATERLRSTEDVLLNLCGDAGNFDTAGEVENLARAWNDAARALEADAAEVGAAIDAAYGGRARASLTELYDAAVASEMQSVRAHYEPLIAAARSEESLDTADMLNFEATRLEQDLESMIQHGDERYATLQSRLAAIEPDFLRLAPDGEERPYQVRRRMYGLAGATLLDEQGTLRAGDENIRLAGAADALAAVEDEVGEASRDVNRLHDQRGRGQRDAEALALCACTVTVAQRYRNYSTLVRVLEAGDLARQVEAATADAAPFRHKRVPLSEDLDEAGQFEARFNPTAAEQILLAASDINQRIRAGASEQTILDSESLRNRFETMERDCDQYLRSYVEYWGAEVPEMLLVGPFETWESFLDGLRDLGDPEYLNEDLDELNRQIESSLAICSNLGGMVDEDLRSRVDRALAVRRRERDALGSATFNRKCAEVVRTWLQLGRDPEGARYELVRSMHAGSAAFRDDYLGNYLETGSDAAAPGAGRSVEYWNSLLRRGIEALAGRSIQEAREAREWLIENGNRFPLCLGHAGGTEMTPEEVDRAWAMVRKIGAGAATSTTDEDAPSIELGAGYHEIEQALRSLFASDVLLAGETTWFARVAALAEALATEDRAAADARDVLVCQIRFVDPTTQVQLFNELPENEAANRDLAINRYTGFSLDPGQNWVDTRFEEAEKVLAAYDVPSRQVRFTFRVRQNEPVGPPPEVWRPDWNVVGALLSPGTVRQDDFSWLVRISLREPGLDTATYYWVKVTFNRVIPALDQWPQANDWPGPGPRFGP